MYVKFETGVAVSAVGVRRKLPLVVDPALPQVKPDAWTILTLSAVLKLVPLNVKLKSNPAILVAKVLAIGPEKSLFEIWRTLWKLDYDVPYNFI